MVILLKSFSWVTILTNSSSGAQRRLKRNDYYLKVSCDEKSVSGAFEVQYMFGTESEMLSVFLLNLAKAV